jgi:hypothetical protein
MRRPGLALAAGVAVLATVALPAFSLPTESHGLAELPAGSEVRQATERAAELTGFTGPIQIFTDDEQAAAEIAAATAASSGIKSVSGVASAPGPHYLVEAVLAAVPSRGRRRPCTGRPQPRRRRSPPGAEPRPSSAG